MVRRYLAGEVTPREMAVVSADTFAYYTSGLHQWPKRNHNVLYALHFLAAGLPFYSPGNISLAEYEQAIAPSALPPAAEYAAAVRDHERTEWAGIVAKQVAWYSAECSDCTLNRGERSWQVRRLREDIKWAL